MYFPLVRRPLNSVVYEQEKIEAFFPWIDSRFAFGTRNVMDATSSSTFLCPFIY